MHMQRSCVGVVYNLIFACACLLMSDTALQGLLVCDTEQTVVSVSVMCEGS